MSYDSNSKKYSDINYANNKLPFVVGDRTVGIITCLILKSEAEITNPPSQG